MRAPLATLLLGLGLLVSGLAPVRAAEPCPPSPTQHLAMPATRAALAQGRKVKVIAFGSSSTEGAGASGQDRTYPAMLEAGLRAALPEARLMVLNRGRGGEDVDEMMARLEADVITLRPTLVIWQAGANAVLRGMSPEAFSAAMEDGIERLQARGIDVVLMDSQRAPRILSAPRFERFDAALRDLSAHLHVPLFSRAALMEAWAAAGTPATEMIGPDGLHHNDHGYACLAQALTHAMLDAAGPRRLARR
ncbi:SGNH/GDSL hydrolase family protein [Belnapia rosea]|uniref:SGNH/GDSL hydrolase family protein n=1 Tax=Belnapia rosea TaxID=938405 RepID=UPI00088EE51C|nr:SGNH/GDSL hydrolase family protein [Belnapia rosea]SDB57763.1 Lysophospholipase L1 [Belnapia rosea]